MRNKTLIYKAKVEEKENMKQSFTHLKRLNDAFRELIWSRVERNY